MRSVPLERRVSRKRGCEVINLIEMYADEQHPSPCANGNIVDGHACYCHMQHENAPRKCPIWRNFGESDLSKWHRSGDFDADEWDGGCKWFVPVTQR